MSFITIILCTSFMSCDSDDPVSQIILETYEFSSSGSISDFGLSKFRLFNYFGGLIIIGKQSDGAIDYYIAKVIRAETQEAAIEAQENIVLQHHAQSDSMAIELGVYYYDDSIDYTGLLSLNLPYESDCRINFADGAVYVSDMVGRIDIENCLNDVEVDRHNGSCDIFTSSGNIDIEAAFSGQDVCFAHTGSGDIQLMIPDTSSASFEVITYGGAISVVNLDISYSINEPQSFIGTIGEGDTVINLVAAEGNITIIGFNTSN